MKSFLGFTKDELIDILLGYREENRELRKRLKIIKETAMISINLNSPEKEFS